MPLIKSKERKGLIYSLSQHCDLAAVGGVDQVRGRKADNKPGAADHAAGPQSCSGIICHLLFQHAVLNQQHHLHVCSLL